LSTPRQDGALTKKLRIPIMQRTPQLPRPVVLPAFPQAGFEKKRRGSSSLVFGTFAHLILLGSWSVRGVIKQSPLLALLVLLVLLWETKCQAPADLDVDKPAGTWSLVLGTWYLNMLNLSVAVKPNTFMIQYVLLSGQTGNLSHQGAVQNAVNAH
jgi:hypothetical protein